MSRRIALAALGLAACNTGDVAIEKPPRPPDSGAFCTVSESLERGFADTLTPSGCGYVVAAADDLDDVRLVLDVPAFATALTAGSAAATYTLPDPDVRLEVDVGCDLSSDSCPDDPDRTPDIGATYLPNAGKVIVTATRDDASGSDADGYTTTASVTLQDVSFESDGNPTVVMPTTTWEDVLLYEADHR